MVRILVVVEVFYDDLTTAFSKVIERQKNFSLYKTKYEMKNRFLDVKIDYEKDLYKVKYTYFVNE